MRSGPAGGIGRARRGRVSLRGGLLPATIAALALGRGGPARGQVGDFDRPMVVLNTGGHQAPPRVLRFVAEGNQLLSAGMDKVVHVWDLDGGRPRIARTIRPPIWRGPAGIIYAMAVSRAAPGRGDLAVAGYGVHIRRGNIALYRFPGAPNRPTGDLVAQLPDDRLDNPNPQGHDDTVMALEFAPDGRTFASCGMDGRLLIWDVARRALVAEMKANDRPLNALGFTPDGSAVVVGGQDGVVRVWEVATRRLRAEARPPRPAGIDPRGDAINALSVTPDGLRIVFGLENGRLYRCDTAAPAASLVALPPLRAGVAPGPVEGLAISHDGRLVAVSQVARPVERGREGDLPEVACAVAVRRVEDGAIVGPVRDADNLVYALAFSPDDRRLAFAGGDDQAIRLVDLGDPARPELVLRGEGRSVWDVGFSADGRIVGLSRVRADRPGAPAESEGFDLHDRRVAPVARSGLRVAQHAWNGWTVRPVDALTLDVLDARGRGHRIALDRDRDRRWWSYSFIPPLRGDHDRPTLAIGCEAGVAFYTFDGPRADRTRLYAGHSGPVYALAPSPDGKWLATGSSDQTVRLWRLAGCDAIPPLGARFGRGADGRWRAEAVAPLGFADLMGLKAGDVVERAIIDVEGRPDEMLARMDAAPPNAKVQLLVRRAGRADPVPLMTTKRDSPVMSLFLGLDGEWVAWMPQGYYETSTAGDRRYLAWHRNGPTATTPTDVFPADRFEREFRRPAVLTTLLATSDLGAALAQVPAALRDPAAVVRADGPPVVRLAAAGAGPTLVAGAQAVIAPEIVSPNARRLTSVRVRVDGRPVGPPELLAAPAASFQEPITVPVPPGEHRITITAVNEAGKERTEGIDVQSPRPPPRAPRLVVLAVGIAGPFGGSDLPPIRYADRDARDLGPFFASLARSAREDASVLPELVDAGATSGAIREAFARLGRENLGPGDTLVVALESHFLTDPEGRPTLAGADSGTAVPAGLVADALATVAADGCKVLLLIDGVHDKAPRGTIPALREWVRGLYRRGVVVFVASTHGPSRRYAPRAHGAFAQGVVESPSARGRSRPWVDPASALTLDDFQATVVARVQELTARRQQAACYLPETLSPRMPLFDAPAK